MANKPIPYKIYLSEDEIPKQWYNLNAAMKRKHDPFLNPATLQPCTADDLRPVFCDDCVAQELNRTDLYIDIPEEIRNFYKMYRPSPLVRAYCMEKALGTPAQIYYKFEGNNTSGSHKLNSAVAQAYYAKKQGLKSITTETGAGQWGTALSMASAYFGLDLTVYMVKVSSEQKPHRKEVMRTYGANVVASPSDTTEAGRKILKEFPGTGGSLGCAISEAVEKAVTSDSCRYVLGSVLDHVVLHQSVIGLESKAALEKYGVQPDMIIGCCGGGSNFGGLIAPFMGDKIAGKNNIEFVGVEPASGLRYHGMSPIVSELYHEGYMRAVAVEQTKVFEAAEQFARIEGILPAPESSHAIRVAIDEALRCKETGEKKVILFGLTGTGYFDMTAYKQYNDGAMSDRIPTDEELAQGFATIPDIPQNRE